MPVIYSNPQFPWQYGWNGTQAYTTQMSFGQMLREVTQWNPDLDPMLAGRFINNAYRQLVDRREWYGLKIKGNIAISPVVNSGQASVTFNSNIAQGYGTSWDQSLVGLQFRVGFTYPLQTIVKVDPLLQQLTLDTLYGGQTITSGGYTITEAYVSLGANIKYLLWSVNQMQGWPMEVGVPVEVLNVFDPWRQSLGWSTILATRAPTPDGQFLVEVWPTPYGNQVFPFEAYTQPPNMEGDNDAPAPFIRCDVLVARAVADAKVFSGRGSKWYDPVVYKMKMDEYNAGVAAMEMADDALDQRSVTWDYGHEEGRVGFGPGSTWLQGHDG